MSWLWLWARPGRQRWGLVEGEQHLITADPRSFWVATLPHASYHSPRIAFGLQPDETVSELHLLWSLLWSLRCEQPWNNLRELRVWAACSCLTWTVASGEYFPQGLRPGLRSSLSSIIERLRVFQQARKGNSARSSHNNKLAEAALENFVQLCKNQHRCVRSGKMVEDSPEESSTLRVALEVLWAQKSCGCNCMSMSWELGGEGCDSTV